MGKEYLEDGAICIGTMRSRVKGIVLSEVVNVVLSTFELGSSCGPLTLVLNLFDGRVDNIIWGVESVDGQERLVVVVGFGLRCELRENLEEILEFIPSLLL